MSTFLGEHVVELNTTKKFEKSLPLANEDASAFVNGMITAASIGNIAFRAVWNNLDQQQRNQVKAAVRRLLNEAWTALKPTLVAFFHVAGDCEDVDAITIESRHEYLDGQMSSAKIGGQISGIGLEASAEIDLHKMFPLRARTMPCDEDGERRSRWYHADVDLKMSATIAAVSISKTAHLEYTLVACSPCCEDGEVIEPEEKPGAKKKAKKKSGKKTVREKPAKNKPSKQERRGGAEGSSSGRAEAPSKSGPGNKAKKTRAAKTKGSKTAPRRAAAERRKPKHKR